jgi:hypothetical protein
MIIQVWITSRLGVIAERLLVADENLLFIRGTFTRRRISVKGIRAPFGLLASSCQRLADPLAKETEELIRFFVSSIQTAPGMQNEE